MNSRKSDIASKKYTNKKQAAVFQLFAEKVSDHKDLVSRWAVLQETRVEYFRGKNFVSFLRNHPELKDILESDRNLEIEDIANVLLRKNLLVRCDRVVKTVRPGKRKLSTWPAHLEIYPFELQHLVLHGSFLESVSDEEERPKWTARLFYAIVAVLVILLLRHHAPDEVARGRYQKRVSNIIDDVLEWSPRLALSGIMEKQQPVVNTTEPNNFTDVGKARSEKTAPPADIGGETFSEQHEDEISRSLEQQEDEVIENLEKTDHDHQHHNHVLFSNNPRRLKFGKKYHCRGQGLSLQIKGAGGLG
ncbi:hypothetical protein F0562_035047 [Nyssa sinensis]|uniref:Translocation protein SEC62 n=1 Tax=Nyssa sinensis TaxID=561372 RepID=A0A5J5AAZ5_9ASTE|nr:hypothetical protein F0562_035047 [Nyssa sinensis]